MGDEATAQRSSETGSHARSDRVKTGWQLLKIRNVRWLWGGQTVSQIGEGLSKVTLLWLVYTLTGSTLKMSIIGLLQTFPPLVLSPLMGVYVDRYPKKRIMIAVDFVRAALALLIPILYVFEMLTLPRLYLVVFVMAIVTTFFVPALSSIVPLIVDRPQLTATNALITSTAMIGMLVGPAISGLGIATIGIENVLYVNSGTFLFSVLCLSQLHARADGNPSERRSVRSFYQDLRAGLRYVLVQRRTLLGLIVAALVYSLVASAFVFLLPVFANEVLGAGAVMLGLLWSAYGGGMVLVAAWLAFTKQRASRRRLLFITVAMLLGTLASFALAHTTTPLLALLLVTAIGASLASFTPIAWGVLQEMTPDDLRGRVFALFNTGAMSSSMIGMVTFGWVTDRLGPRSSLLGMAGIFLITAAASGLLTQQGDFTPARQRRDTGR